jgi:ribosomal protein L40E
MDTKPLAVGTILRNRYQVMRLIAGGGMAWIYQVQEQRPDGSGVIWAMKELRLDVEDSRALAEARLLFEQEANILVRLSHPNLPKVAAFFAEDGRSYLIMEYVHGESLQKRLDAAQGPLLESEVTPYAIQMCDVLSYLHGQPMPVIFRDLKPSNIMVTPAGQVKLIDFGIARTFKQGQARDTVSMGSENYAAPEQWGRAQSDGRADVYGLGATLFHLLAGAPPLPAFVPGPRSTLESLNSAVSPQLRQVIATAMSPDREQRYATAAHMRQALVECLSPWDRLRLRVATRPERSTPLTGLTLASAVNKPATDGRDSAHAPTVMVETTADDVYCEHCGAGNRARARFCRQCGQPLAAPVRAHLAVVEPTDVGWQIPLLRANTLIGRPHGQRPVDLDVTQLDAGGYVSRNHAIIETAAEGHQITDLGSANGTLVNGRRLRPHRPLRLASGDQIRLGKLLLAYRTDKVGA